MAVPKIKCVAITQCSTFQCRAFLGLRRFRTEFPAQYETYVDLAPGEWTKVRIEVRGEKVRLYVHNAPHPTLLVNDLKQRQSNGAIALWVGPGTIAHFSKLRFSP